ncbi:metalloregulator ArsR/SmtB family transcription factor [Chelativorans sp. Marseille-P2723]|uniref:ArsR/SmtB family transcription factor n=1 Tax=Chelativorans sp. Marseille-P2723 TaxID=2709133 RepID=UPI00156EEDF2|nr:metalloregulator ArsR/SmtB family transcription factor [Chelativorans sp. Marseille-P2723]
MSQASALRPYELTVLSETFRLLGDPSRLKILLCCSDGPKSVSKIAAELQLSQSLVSHHLRLLRGARLVRGERQSKKVFYEIADKHVSDMLSDMISHIREDRSEH